MTSEISPLQILTYFGVNWLFLVSSVELNMEYNVDPSVQITDYLWLYQQQGVAALPANAAGSRHNLLSAASFFLPGRSPQMLPLPTHPPKGLLSLGHHKMLTLTISLWPKGKAVQQDAAFLSFYQVYSGQRQGTVSSGLENRGEVLHGNNQCTAKDNPKGTQWR